MKKALSFILAAVMLFALAVPAFAVDNVTSGNNAGSASENVTADYEAGKTTAATVYLVNVTWGVTSELKYSDGTTTYIWNANTTEYTQGTTSGQGWTGDAKVDITVTNKSNAAITATASWANAQGITAACTFDSEKDKVDVESAATGTDLSANQLKGSEKTGTIKATVTVSNGTITQSNAVVGTITVNIAAKAS